MGKKIVVNDDAENKYERYKGMGNPARVGTTVSITKNLGDYNSLSIRFNAEDNVAEDESLDDAAERVYAFVESKVEEKLAEYEAD